MKGRLDSTANRAILCAVVLAVLLGYVLWRCCQWLPSVRIEGVQSFLATIIQAQAGILTIALSFSLLYVQVSVDAYSLRGARLLLRHRPFRRMIFYYVLSLTLSSVLALLLSDRPAFLPLLFGLLSGAAFIAGLVILVRYIASVVYYITPENIVFALQEEMVRTKIEEEAKKVTAAHDSATRFTPIRVPIGISEQTGIGDDLRVLIDIAKRMVARSDHVAVRSAIEGIVVLNPHKSLPMALRDQEEAENARRGTVEEVAEKARQYEQVAGAMLAYRVGTLLEIWAAALGVGDQATAAMIVDATGRMIGSHYSDVLSSRVGQTDVLKTAVYSVMFKDAGSHEWWELRRRIVRLVTRPVQGVDDADPSSGLYGYAWSVFQLLSEMGADLLTEERADFPCEQEVFDGIAALGQHGAAAGDASMVSNVSIYLRNRAQRGCAPQWRGQGYMGGRPMAQLVGEMGDRWVRVDPSKAENGKTFRYLLDDGTRAVVEAYNQAVDRESQMFPSSENTDYLDALERIARACIEVKQWHYLKRTLSAMNELVTDTKRSPEFAARCFSIILERAVQESEPTAIKLWAEAVQVFLSDNSKIEAKFVSRHLLRTTRKAQSNTAVGSGSEVATCLSAVVQQLERAEAERSTEE